MNASSIYVCYLGCDYARFREIRAIHQVTHFLHGKLFQQNFDGRKDKKILHVYWWSRKTHYF